MDDLFDYLFFMELMLFFSGYPLIYLLVTSFASKSKPVSAFRYNISRLLPFAYAGAGLLYLGLKLKNIFPDLDLPHLRAEFSGNWLQFWGLSAILFFIPCFSRRPVFSLLHSLVFFFFIARDIVERLTSTADRNIVKNNMNIYAYSLLVNLAVFVVIVIGFLLVQRLSHKNPKNLH
jgi:hypothetical protein